MSDLWVCSRWNTEPKDSEKHKVRDVNKSFYQVLDAIDDYLPYLPKSDYIPCPAPEQWEPVEVTVGSLDVRTGIQHILCHYPQDPIGYVQFSDKGYRVVSLVVERRTR